MATYTPPSGNYGAMDRINKNLPKDQQKLADAVAKDKNAYNTTLGIASKAAETGLEELGLAAGIKGAGVLTGSKAIAGVGSTMLTAPVVLGAASLAGGYEAGKRIDEEFGLSDRIANTLGPMYARLKGVDTNTGAISPEERAAIASGRNPALEQKGNIVEQPMTPMELQAIREGKNPLKPIYDTNSLASASVYPSLSTVAIPNVIGYEEMAGKSQQEREAIASEDLGATFEGMYKTKDGQMMGQLAAPNAQSSGMNRIMSPQEVAAFENNQVLNEQPRVSGTPEEGLREFTDARGNVAYGNESAIRQFSAPATPATLATSATPAAPSAPRMTAGQQAQANFERFKASGQEMTPEQFLQASELAASAGRTFDVDTGYSKDLDPVLRNAYLAPQESQAQGVQPSTPMGTTSRDAGLSSYERESRAREARIDERSDFSQPQIRVGGEMVPATDENRKRRDLEKSLKAEAKREGLTPEETRTYISDEMQDRSQEEEDRAIQKEMNELNISNAQARLSVTLRSLMPEAVEKMSREDYFGFIRGLEEMGVSMDSETGQLLQVDERLGPDGTKPLNPNSALFQQVMELEGGDQFLAAPKDVKGDLAGQPVGTKSMSQDGTNRVWEVVDAQGNLRQVL